VQGDEVTWTQITWPSLSKYRLQWRMGRRMEMASKVRMVNKVRAASKALVINKTRVGMRMNIDYACIFPHFYLPLFQMDKAEINVTISEVLNYKPVVVWGWWKNVDCSDDTVNKTKFKMSLLWSLKFKVTSEFVPRLSSKGLDNCYPKCLPIHGDREESTHLSKEEA